MMSCRHVRKFLVKLDAAGTRTSSYLRFSPRVLDIATVRRTPVLFGNVDDVVVVDGAIFFVVDGVTPCRGKYRCCTSCRMCSGCR